ncbi:MAG: hypothetical protein LAT57_03115 [Balneolales bacterium]|nr:hypothetical protein [Balneolales bacterium]
MKYIFLSVIFSLLLVQLAASQEVQIPFDDAGNYLTLNRQLNSELQLFPEVTGFFEARLFQRENGSRYAEVSYTLDDRILRDRIEISDERLSEIRRKITEYESYPVTRTLNHDGRVKFLRTNTMMNLFYYGFAIPSALDMNVSSSVSYYMLSTGAAFYIPYAMTKNQDVTMPMANLSRYGATRGIYQGANIYTLLLGSDATQSGSMVSATLASISGLSLGFVQARNQQLTEGQVGIIGLYGDYGLFGGQLAGAAINGYESDRLMAGLGLAGGVIGYSAASYYAKSFTRGLGDVRVMRALMGLGAISAVTLNSYSGTTSEQMYAGVAVLGGGVGLLYSRRFIEPYNFTESQGSLLRLSSVVGYAVGAGTYVLLFDGIDDGISTFLTLGNLGAIGGFLIMLNSIKNDARISNNNLGSKLQFDVNPLAVLGVRTSSMNHSNLSNPINIFNLRYHF